MDCTKQNQTGFDACTALTYWFAHFAVEVLCFYAMNTVFDLSDFRRWIAALLFDTIAFVPQAGFGMFFEQHKRLKPGVIGGAILIAGAAVILLGKGGLVYVGVAILTCGNAIIHISGALATSRVSEGRLSESAIFVGGGSFGVITGTLLASAKEFWALAFIPIILAIPLMYFVDRRIRDRYREEAFDFVKRPLAHNIITNKNRVVIIITLTLIVAARSFIGYGLPTGWVKLSRHTVLLFVFMGFGKMLGGILSDLFGAKNVGIVSCLLAVPILLVSNQIMWLSLIGIALFSMTMAITLGGLYSVLRYSPGFAFGLTTIGLFIGLLPTFFMEMPEQFICNILNIVLSVVASVGIWYCITNHRSREDVVC